MIQRKTTQALKLHNISYLNSQSCYCATLYLEMAQVQRSYPDEMIQNSE